MISVKALCRQRKWEALQRLLRRSPLHPALRDGLYSYETGRNSAQTNRGIQRPPPAPRQCDAERGTTIGRRSAANAPARTGKDVLRKLRESRSGARDQSREGTNPRAIIAASASAVQLAATISAQASPEPAAPVASILEPPAPQTAAIRRPVNTPPQEAPRKRRLRQQRFSRNRILIRDGYSVLSLGHRETQTCGDHVLFVDPRAKAGRRWTRPPVCLHYSTSNIHGGFDELICIRSRRCAGFIRLFCAQSGIKIE